MLGPLRRSCIVFLGDGGSRRLYGSKTAKIFGFEECIAIWCVLFVVEMDESVILVLFGKGLLFDLIQY